MSIPLMIFALLAPGFTTGCGGSSVALDESAAPAPTKAEGTVRIRIVGFRNQDGQALVSLFAGPKGFPDKGDLSLKRVAKKIAEDELEVVFDKIPAGEYAVAVLHDEDMDFKMKRGTFGIPKEGYGVSKNVKARFGPPKFKDAKFEVGKGAGVDLTIALVYL